MFNKLIVKIRKIETSDSSSIVQLNQELGYKTNLSMVQKHIQHIISENDQYAYVATIGHKIVGFIHGFIAIRLTGEPFGEIAGLIVSKQFRNQGIGKMLVEKLEMAINDIQSIRVRCNSKRILAHNFYYKMDYELKKEQKIFSKTINS
ncbi:GNAT family N-acetyltransferase [Aureibacter tunicatorum]|uniref:Ribosomal protein S18 acetylase RimI-like enzyme n=1 Tax=Aureibacter tunicatorum TaxID=866807 RepID=A0AAE4BTK3_9BACT|nr:GNAT family N-acetyltransferase [Aureibacter tunicatorum]MDR6240055.1 ribosomal protein S18 acetylase RimI-like enzyme [Aureibacter tunicatorum]BDD04527.1 hypothetical protein AUTU_20100 [Aureibacter tunicatorum]